MKTNGGYIIGTDHSVPDDVSLDQFQILSTLPRRSVNTKPSTTLQDPLFYGPVPSLVHKQAMALLGEVFRRFPVAFRHTR